MSLTRKHSTSTISTISWQEKLSSLDLNTVHDNRTCEIFFMAEQTEVCSKAVENFRYGAELDSLNAVKSVSFEDVLTSIKYFSDDSSPSVLKAYDDFFKRASKDALNCIEKGDTIPCKLISYLIKLEIILAIHQDVTITQKQLLKEKNLADERAALIELVEGKDKAGKGKGKSAKGTGGAKGKGAVKGKGGAKGKGGKGKGGPALEKAYDACDTSTVIKPKPSSRLNKDNRESLAYESFHVDDKHLFIVILGFYEFELIEELFKIAIPLTGILEIAKPEYLDISLGSALGDVDDETETAEVILNSKNSTGDVSLNSYNQTIKTKVLVNFWSNFSEHFENDDFPSYFENTFHMTISPSDLALSEQPLRDQQYLEIFADVGTEIVKTMDIMRQHINYTRNLKICQVGPKPRPKSSSTFKLYNSIMDMVPPDCCNVPFILYAMIEQVNSLIVDQNQVTTSSLSTESNIFLRSIPEIRTSHVHSGIKGFLTDVLNRNVNVHALFGAKSLTKHDHVHNPKIDFKISRKPFLIHENNDLEITIHPYENISSEFIKICTAMLKLNRPVLLRKWFADTEQLKVLVNEYELQRVCELLQLPLHELQYAIHTILFNSVVCSNRKQDDCAVPCSCFSLETLFPQCKDTAPNVETVDVPEPPRGNFNPESEPKISLPYAKYTDKPNIYEAKNMSTYKWYENLSAVMMLQELNKSEQEYLCLDYKYCAVDDTLLLRYHNNLNKFGINRKTWNQSLRTPVGLKEFCKHIIHEESSWLAKQEGQYVEEFEKEFEELRQKDKQTKQIYYPDLIFTDLDFLRPDSLKAKKIMEQRALKDKPKEDVGKSKGKGKGKDAGKAKGKGASKGKGKGDKKSKKDSSKAKSGPPSQITVLEKVSQPIIPPARRKLTLRVAAEEPYSFHAYDVSKNRMQLTGSTIVFHSQDGVKITVDQTRFFRSPSKISLDISMKGNSLILHHDKTNCCETFAFHFSLTDQTVIVFAKPPRPHSPEEKICEKICRAMKYRKRFPEKIKEQQLYFVSEQQNHVLKCFNIPYISKRHLILSEEMMVPFLEQLGKRKMPVKLIPSRETLSLSEIAKFDEAVKSSRANNPEEQSGPNGEFVCETLSPKYTYGIISKIPSESTSVVIEGHTSSSEHLLAKSRRPFTSETHNLDLLRKKSNRTVLNKIKKAMESRLPIFKICSSRLHKYQYVKRVKSYVEVQVGPILKRLSFRAPFYKAKSNVEVTKLLPVKPCNEKSNCKYDFRVCLPSGLLIQNVPGIDKEPFNIRQKYLDVGPQCKDIAHESYRMFMRSGIILIKKADGNVDILHVNRQMAYCDVPYLKVRSNKNSETSPRTKERKTCKSDTAKALHAHASHLTKFQKYLQRHIHRFKKHSVDGLERQHHLSHKACQRWKKNHITDKEQVYILQDTIAPLTKFSLITSDGQHLRISKKASIEETKFYTATVTDYRYEEMYYGREDGTHSVLNRESILVTQFPDGTRISSWIDIAPEYLIIVEKEDPECFNDRCHKQQQTEDEVRSSTISSECDGETVSEEAETNSEEMKEEECTPDEETSTSEMNSSNSSKIKIKPDDYSWVSIFINFKYEHPNYATVIYYGMSNETEIILPNNITLKATSKGEFAMNIYETISAKINCEKLLLESQFCTSCMEKCVSLINVKPLYDALHPIPCNTELLRTTDSFSKVFTVNYDGKCYKNVRYHLNRSNAVGCANHDKSEHQKLFLFTKNLNGCKFWDVNAYKNKIMEAQKHSNTIIESPTKQGSETVSSTTIRSFINKPCDEKFVIPYLEPMLILQKNKIATNEPAKTYYVTRQVIDGLPGLSKLYPVYSILMELCQTRGIEEIGSSGAEFSLFLNQIIIENLRREEKLLEEQIAKLEAERTVVEVKEPPVPLLTKLIEWREDCQKYKTQISQRCVPKYFHSQYDTFYMKTLDTQLNSSKSDPETSVVSIACNAEASQEISATEKRSDPSITYPSSSMVEDIRGVHDSVVDNSEKETGKDFTCPSEQLDDSETKTTSKFEDGPSNMFFSYEISSRSKSTKKPGEDENRKVSNQNTSLSDKNEVRKKIATSCATKSHKTPWCETTLGKELLNEMENRISSAAKFSEVIGVESASLHKIECMAKRVLRNTMLAVESYEKQAPLNDYVAAAATTITESILNEQPNSLELNLLLKLVRKPSAKVMDSLCLPDTDRLSEYCSDLFKGCNLRETYKEYPEESAFDIYNNYYSTIYSVSKSIRIESKESLSAAFEAPQLPLKTSDLAENTKSESASLSSSISYDAGEKCKICSVRSKVESVSKISGNATPSSQRSLTNYAGKFPSVRSFADSSSIQRPSSSIKQADSSVTYHGESSTSNAITPNILLSPESSLLRYCLSEVSVRSENMAAVDGNTTGIMREEMDRPESMMVLFSVASLKEKDTEITVAGPYIERAPDEIIDKITMTAKPPHKKKLPVIHPHAFQKPEPDAESVERLMSEDSLYGCKSCILKSSEVSAPAENVSDVKPTSLHSVTDVIKLIKSSDSLAAIDKGKMGPSLLNIYEECLKGPKKSKQRKAKLDATIWDEDHKVVKAGTSRKNIHSVLTARALPRRNVVKSSLGTLTQPGTTDIKSQTGN